MHKDTVEIRPVDPYVIGNLAYLDRITLIMADKRDGPLKIAFLIHRDTALSRP